MEFYFYHYAVMSMHEAYGLAYHHGTVRMDRKVICDSSYSEIVHRIEDEVIRAQILRISEVENDIPKEMIEMLTQEQDFCVNTLTLLHHGEYQDDGYRH